MAKNTDSPQSDKRKELAHQKLLTELSELIQETGRTGSQALNQAKLNSYWQIGKRLIRSHNTENIALSRLARELSVQQQILYRSVHFFETWPDGLTPDAKRLPWGHHILLLGLTNSKARDFYVTQALTRAWNRPTLQRAVARDEFRIRTNTPDSALTRDDDPLFVYKAILEHVVDGDTLEVKVDLGFQTWSSQRLRLRGINTSELARPNAPSADSDRAERAKAFVAEKLASVPFLVVKTYKTDIYGRYVADVFYHPTLTDRRDVARKGFFLNEELVREGLAGRV